MTERKFARRTMSLLGVGALGLGVIMGSGAAAVAAPQDFGDLDLSRIGSLTVHKYLHQATPRDGDVSQAPAPGDFSNPVEGVVFTVYPLHQGGSPLDLGVSTNWDQLSTLTPGAACTAPAGFELGAPIVLPATDAEGTATAPLPVGAYQVCETSAPAQIVDRGIPFILTVPAPYESGWVYDVHAYPKNGEGSFVKEVDPQQQTGLGSVMRFPVTATVPTMQATWTGFAISDTLDARLAPLAAADIAVTLDGVPLDPSFYTLTVSGQDITMNFTAAGLAWLNEGPNAHVGAEIQVVFAGTVVSLGNGSIENEAILWTNNPGFDADGQKLPSNVVTTYWGSLQVEKRAAGAPSASLSGAVFEVYNAADPYAADCTLAESVGAALVVNGASEFTSDVSGVVTIAGLFVGDSENAPVDPTQRCYVLKEVQAPAGYVLPADPFTGVKVLAGQTVVADNAPILNTQQTLPQLPLTGAAGQIFFIAAGIGAVGVVIGLLLIKRRRAAASN